MNKWKSISITSVLVVGLAASLFLYFQKSSSLKDAESEIVSLEGNVSTLEGNVSTLESTVSTLETDLAAAEAEVTRLDGELTTAETQVATLQTDLSTAEAQVATLQTNLSAAEAKVFILQADLASAEAQVSTLQADLASAEAQVSSLSAELAIVQAPRHFTSLQELNNWLVQDDTDTAYTNSTDFQLAFILQVRALRDGYLLPVNMEDYDEDYNIDIGGNIAYIGDTGYLIFAADDFVIEWFRDVFPYPTYPIS